MFARRLISSVVVAVLVASVTGVPVPRAPESKSEEDFPCKYHGCGCVDAHMCRTACCCFKPASKSGGGEGGSSAGGCCSAKHAPDAPKSDAHTGGIQIQSPSCRGVQLMVGAGGVVFVYSATSSLPDNVVEATLPPPASARLSALAGLMPHVPPPRNSSVA